MSTKISKADAERAALSYLAHAYTKEAGQPVAAGFRDTRQVADYLQVKTPTARRILDRLYAQDLVDCYDDRPLTWCINSVGLVFAKIDAMLSARKSGGAS